MRDLLLPAQPLEAAPFPDASHGIDAAYLWQGTPKRVGALAGPSFYVGLVHSGNTNRKDTRDAWWHPRGVDEIESLMGSDWEDYRRPAKR